MINNVSDRRVRLSLYAIVIDLLLQSVRCWNAPAIEKPNAVKLNVNLLVSIIDGIALVGFCRIVYFLKPHTMLHFPPAQDIDLMKIITFVNVVFFVASILCMLTAVGYVGAISESQILLRMFTISMAMFTTTNIYVVVKFFENMDYVQEIVEKLLGDAFNNPQTRVFFFVLEYIFDCCGTTSSGVYNELGLDIPLRCCEILDYNYECHQQNASVGCNYKLGKLVLILSYGVGCFLVLIIALEIAALVFSLVVRYYIKIKNQHF